MNKIEYLCKIEILQKEIVYASCDELDKLLDLSETLSACIRALKQLEHKGVNNGYETSKRII